VVATRAPVEPQKQGVRIDTAVVAAERDFAGGRHLASRSHARSCPAVLARFIDLPIPAFPPAFVDLITPSWTLIPDVRSSHGQYTLP